MKKMDRTLNLKESRSPLVPENAQKNKPRNNSVVSNASSAQSSRKGSTASLDRGESYKSEIDAFVEGSLSRRTRRKGSWKDQESVKSDRTRKSSLDSSRSGKHD